MTGPDYSKASNMLNTSRPRENDLNFQMISKLNSSLTPAWKLSNSWYNSQNALPWPIHALLASVWILSWHYSDVIMSAIASQITGVSIICLTFSSGADQRKHQSSTSVAFVRRIHLWSVDSPHKSPVTQKMFLFDGVFMEIQQNDLQV